MLLQQVQQVSSELQEARVLIATFKAENEALESNFETLKEQLVDTRKKYNVCKEELLEASERALANDQKHEAFREEVTAGPRPGALTAGRVPKKA